MRRLGHAGEFWLAPESVGSVAGRSRRHLGAPVLLGTDDAVVRHRYPCIDLAAARVAAGQVAVRRPAAAPLPGIALGQRDRGHL
jgi:hypothetical protein